MIPGPFKIVTTTELSSPAATVTFSDFSGIPTGSKHLVFLLNTKAVSGSGNYLVMRFNSDSGANYYGHKIFTTPDNGPPSGTEALKDNGITTPSVGTIPSSTYTYATTQIIIPHYSNTANHKALLAYHANANNLISFQAMHWQNTAAITRVDFTIQTGVSFDTGSVFILAVMDETYNIGTADISSTGTATFSGIGGTNEDLVMVGYGRANGAYTGDSMFLDINGDDAQANRAREALYGYNSTLTAEYGNSRRFAHTLGNGSNANRFAPFVLFIQQYADSTSTYPHTISFSGSHQNNSEATSEVCSVTWNNTSAITTLQPYSGNSSGKQWMAGTYISLYRLPRNRILNHDLSSGTTPLGGSLSSTTSDFIAGSWYARTSSYYRDTPRLEVNDDTGNQSIVIFGTNWTSIVVYSYNGNDIGAAGSSAYVSGVYVGGPVLIVKPHKTDRYKNTLIASGIPFFSIHGNLPFLWLLCNKWANTASITKLELNGYYGDSFVAGSQFQIESSDTPAASSGFFLRFL